MNVQPTEPSPFADLKTNFFGNSSASIERFMDCGKLINN